MQTFHPQLRKFSDSGGLCPKDPSLEIVFLANKYNLQFSFNINKKLLQNDLKMHISDRNLPKKFPGGQAPEPSAGGGTPLPHPPPRPPTESDPPLLKLLRRLCVKQYNAQLVNIKTHGTLVRYTK